LICSPVSCSWESKIFTTHNIIKERGKALILNDVGVTKHGKMGFPTGQCKAHIANPQLSDPKYDSNDKIIIPVREQFWVLCLAKLISDYYKIYFLLLTTEMYVLHPQISSLHPYS
jgi:hypothetical protein